MRKYGKNKDMLTLVLNGRVCNWGVEAMGLF